MDHNIEEAWRKANLKKAYSLISVGLQLLNLINTDGLGAEFMENIAHPNNSIPRTRVKKATNADM
jgi:hypothetical protein